MSAEQVPCLYCQTKNDAENQQCSHCGMPLANAHPEGEKTRQGFFVKAFWGIVIFCIIMMIYLPR
jgi:hypothetical protein